MKMMSRDKARIQTDRKLDQIDGQIGRVYKDSPALLSVEKEYAKYMAMVKKRTESAYKAYIEAEDKDTKAENRKAYMGELKRYTLESAEYKKLVDKITDALAEANSEALGIINDAMVDVYVDNYNAVADECERVGIKVNGKK